MLFWKFFYTALFLLTLFNIFFNNYSLLFLMLNTELLVLVFLFILFYLSIIYSIYWFIGLGLIYLILGGLELSLCILIINL